MTGSAGPVRRWAFRLLRALVVTYVAILVLLFGFQRQLLYPAGKELPSLERAGLIGVMAPVTFDTADGLALHSWYRAPSGRGAPVILFIHGNGGTIENRAEKARFYVPAGLGLLLLEYRGYGGNPGSPSEAGLYEDGRAALAFLVAQGIALDRVVLFGESLGTGVAVQLAVEQRVAALVLASPYSSIADVAQSHFPLLPVWWLVRDRFDSVAKVGRVGVPLLVLHGERDQTIPVRFGRALFAAASEPKEAVWLPDAGHNIVFQRETDIDVLGFLRRQGIAR